MNHRKLQWPRIIEGAAKHPPQGLRCPHCFGRSFKMSAVQSGEGDTIWVCEACHKDYYASDLHDNTPEGCIAVTQERPAESIRCPQCLCQEIIMRPTFTRDQADFTCMKCQYHAPSSHFKLTPQGCISISDEQPHKEPAS